MLGKHPTFLTEYPTSDATPGFCMSVATSVGLYNSLQAKLASVEADRTSKLRVVAVDGESLPEPLEPG